MPPFFESINIADLILVLKFGNNKFLIYSGEWRDSKFKPMKLRYLASGANHQARKDIDNDVALVQKKA